MNIWDIIYLDCEERYEDIVDHRSCELKLKNLRICEIKAWKNAGLILIFFRL